MATCFYGWALAQQGQAAEGVAHIRQGIAAWRNTGAALAQPHWLTLLAEGCAQAGQSAAGLRAVAAAFALVEQHAERYCEADLYRLQGDLLVRQTPALEQEAERCWHQALDIGRRQQAKSLELRAAMSISRLWQRQGKTTEARDLLTSVYNWFTEGFDTTDLQEAKTLLDELAASRS